ncbi:Predicted PurR-regulated permease PerM [Dyadobacter soli]|uniref:Predicted PurR-regulated permease PerM n=1 Tax=Dyadobacter soli TaxID=659014 RepID=A0A1G6VT86_9BACT|nr:AI-2E family transporter [Dyadobacter soli]SDD56900.1 Predicted PurR-regulated permease PerM [Dyadobacter soli]
MVTDFNNRIRQIAFLLIVTALAVVVFRQLYIFFPGFLGALTLYILCRRYYFHLTEQRKWKKGLTAILFMVLFMACIVAPVYFAIQMIVQKIDMIVENPEQVNHAMDAITAQLKEWTGQDLLTKEATADIRKKAASFIPGILNSSAMMLGNLLMILFLAYFMFKNGRLMEETLEHYIPLKHKNIQSLADEICGMVRANALGIPLVSLIQGLVALLGYWIVGIEDFVLLGLITGLCAFFPVIGTAMIWLPLVIFLFSKGETGRAIGLAAYSVTIIGNIDYVARVTLLQKVGNVHPVITILGLIAGLRLFGFWGFIFGPLLISLVMLLIRIYRNEFAGEAMVKRPPTTDR